MWLSRENMDRGEMIIISSKQAHGPRQPCCIVAKFSVIIVIRWTGKQMKVKCVIRMRLQQALKSWQDYQVIKWKWNVFFSGSLHWVQLASEMRFVCVSCAKRISDEIFMLFGFGHLKPSCIAHKNPNLRNPGTKHVSSRTWFTGEEVRER